MAINKTGNEIVRRNTINLYSAGPVKYFVVVNLYTPLFEDFTFSSKQLPLLIEAELSEPEMQEQDGGFIITLSKII